jgi:hypothetical protein
MAVLSKQKLSLAGLAPTYAAAAAGGDTFVNDQADGSRTFLHIKNTGGSPITVTLDDPNSKQPEGSTAWNPDLAVTVPATTGDRMIGPVGGRFIDGNGNTAITYSATPTGVTVAVLYF